MFLLDCADTRPKARLNVNVMMRIATFAGFLALATADPAVSASVAVSDCVDNGSFIVVIGYGCVDWVGYPCTAYAGYIAAVVFLAS